MRSLLMLAGAIALGSAAPPDSHVAVSLAAGRLLVFAEPLSERGASPDAPDVSVAGRDVTGFGPTGRVLVDTDEAVPHGFAALAPGDYRVQVVLDRDGNSNRLGRGPGDLVSAVTTLQFPLASVPTIWMYRALPPEGGQFDTAGLPPRAAEQIDASRATPMTSASPRPR